MYRVEGASVSNVLCYILLKQWCRTFYSVCECVLMQFHQVMPKGSYTSIGEGL